MGGQWPTSLASHHINSLELLVIFLALQKFQPQLQGQVVQVFSDNTTAVAYLNKQGGTVSRSLCHLSLLLWDFCIRENITPIANHLPRVNNSLADAVSRGALSLHELRVDPASLQPVFNRWGVPKIDVFALAENKQCNLFCNRGRQPQVLR